MLLRLLACDATGLWCRWLNSCLSCLLCTVGYEIISLMNKEGRPIFGPTVTDSPRDRIQVEACSEPVLSFMRDDIELTVKEGRLNHLARLNSTNFEGMRKQVAKNVKYILDNWQHWAVIVKSAPKHWEPLVRNPCVFRPPEELERLLSHREERRAALTVEQSMVLSDILTEVCCSPRLAPAIT